MEYIIEDEVQNGNPEKIKFPSLKHLSLIDLPNLKGLSKEQGSKEAFPNLKLLEITRCSSLILPPLSALQKLETLECSNSTLALFSELDTLKMLGVEVEEKLTCFPVETVVKFSNLERLTISGAKEISVTGEGEALQALKKLGWFSIVDCEAMRCLPKGMVQQFTALRRLEIYRCPELVELPQEIKHLQNLEYISLFYLEKMASLPEALQHLSSLKSLHLGHLPQLGSLPDWLHHLTSLHTMIVEDCAMLASLPDLPNLKKLRIVGCPEVERRCRRGTGEDWHKIAHIPRLNIG